MIEGARQLPIQNLTTRESWRDSGLPGGPGRTAQPDGKMPEVIRVALCAGPADDSIDDEVGMEVGE
jgi:hypothetical protein